MASARARPKNAATSLVPAAMLRPPVIRLKAGRASVMNRTMIAMTTRSSVRVNPR